MRPSRPDTPERRWKRYRHRCPDTWSGPNGTGTPFGERPRGMFSVNMGRARPEASRRKTGDQLISERRAAERKGHPRCPTCLGDWSAGCTPTACERTRPDAAPFSTREARHPVTPKTDRENRRNSTHSRNR